MRSARRVGAFVLVLATLAFWGGCGTDNGNPPDEPAGPAPKPTPGSQLDAAAPDGATAVDPTPDGGDVCIDKNDPGSTEASAKALPGITDDDPQGSTVSGVLSGAADVDFYDFQGTDSIGNAVDPTITSSTSGLEICMFVACDKQPTSFSGCSNGGAQTTSGIGNPGCCVASPGTTTLTFSCGGAINTDDSAHVFLRVKQTGNACLSYSVDYHF